MSKFPNTADKTEQRKFGLVMAVAVTVIGLIRWWFHGFGAFPWGYIYIAAAFGVPGLLFPRVLQPVFWAWMKFSVGLNWVMTRLILSLAFFLMIVPMRVILMIVRHDPLNRSWKPDLPSYWEDAEEQPEDLERYMNQF